MGKMKCAASGSNRTSELRLVLNDQTSRYKVHPECTARLVEGMPLWMPPELFFEMVDGLRGWRKGLAEVMVTNLLVFCTGGGRRLTGLPHVDGVLMELYRRIDTFASVNGMTLEPLF